MLKFGNKEFRNLQEQVKKNMDDILFILQEEGVLNEFGIKVVGQEDSVANMPTVADYKENNPDWSYGDAYAIGEEDPYELYILTRANGTHPNDYWFNIGQFPVPGPQGPKGDTGETGPQGEQGNPGVNGTSAGFGVISTTVTTLTPGSDATVSVVASGPDSSKNFAFSFGIPRGADGQDAPTPTIDWGEINGNLEDQTDLVTALQGKQNTLVSGTNIKTINNESILGSGNITIDGKNNVLDLGSASSVTDEQLALLDADESLLIYATYGAYGKQLYVFRGEYTTGNLTYVSVPNKGSDNVEFLTLVINKSTKAITKSASNVFAGVSKIEVNGATYTPTMGKVVLPNYPTPGGSIDLTASATATSVSSTVPASASVTVDTSGDTPNLAFSFSIPQGEKGETGATGATGPAGQDGLTTKIEVNGATYTQVGGTITLPNYPTIPTLATVATTGDYDDLTNKPTIPTVNNASLDIQVNGATVGTFSANASVNATANITVPTNVSDLNNDSGFITGITSGDVTTALGYTPLSTVTSGDVTGALGYTPYSSTNPSGYISGITSGDVTTALGYTPGTSNFSGNYNDLTNKPTIPDVSGFISSVNVNGSTYTPTGGNLMFPTVVLESDLPTLTISTATVSGASDLGSIKLGDYAYNVPGVSGVVKSIVVNGSTYTPSSGVVTLPTYPDTSSLVSSIVVNGATYTPTSGAVSLPTVPTMATPTSVTTETWTFTLDDDSTVTKTVVVGA